MTPLWWSRKRARAREHARRPERRSGASTNSFLPRKEATNEIALNAETLVPRSPWRTALSLSLAIFLALKCRSAQKVFNVNHGGRPGGGNDLLRAHRGVVRLLRLHSQIIPRIVRPETRQFSTEAAPRRSSGNHRARGGIDRYASRTSYITRASREFRHERFVRLLYYRIYCRGCATRLPRYFENE